MSVIASSENDTPDIYNKPLPKKRQN